jgi:hypothetical protein
LGHKFSTGGIHGSQLTLEFLEFKGMSLSQQRDDVQEESECGGRSEEMMRKQEELSQMYVGSSQLDVAGQNFGSVWTLLAGCTLRTLLCCALAFLQRLLWKCFYCLFCAPWTSKRLPFVKMIWTFSMSAQT